MSAHAAPDDRDTTPAAGPRRGVHQLAVAAIAALTVICLALIVGGRPQDAGGLACLAMIAGTVLVIVFRRRLTR